MPKPLFYNEVTVEYFIQDKSSFGKKKKNLQKNNFGYLALM